MPFPFVVATTSHLTFQTNFTSNTHPSLPTAATSQRNIVRSALKSHKRLNLQDQSGNLSNLVSCISDYLKYLISIDYALSGKSVAGEDVEIALAVEVEVEWRPTLASSTVPGKEPDRVKARGLDYEIYSVHHTLAVIQNLLARQSLLGLYASVNPTAEQRTAMIQSALKSLHTAHSIHDFLGQKAHSSDGATSFPPQAVDVSPAVQSALQRLAQAEVNLLFVLKDDPYPALLVQSRNKNDKEWMIKAPTIPKVRAQVLTRLCIGAAEHASAASAALRAEEKRISKDLIDYVDDIRKTARARACRFQAVDTDLSGQTGQAIAWLHAGLNELGIEIPKETNKPSALSISKLKSTWNERKEDKKISKGSASAKWGSDGGKIEEGRIIEHLEQKYTKANNTINVQIVPEWRPLSSMLPSGRNMPIDERWVPILLNEDELTPMRGPLEVNEHYDDGDSSGEDEAQAGSPDVIGAYPQTRNNDSGASYY